MRLTTPLASVRLRCESLALMEIMRNDPAKAMEWQNLMTDNAGRAFFISIQPTVKALLSGWDLAWSYDNASSTSLHSRFSGLSLGLEVITSIDDQHRIHQDFRVRAQEFDRDNPDLFLLFTLHVLRVQDRILRNLAQTCPELSDPILTGSRIPGYKRQIDRLYSVFARQRPDLAKRAGVPVP